jgi:hypothetical protein
MTVNWGDGMPPESHATGLTHAYGYAGLKMVRFSCPNWSKVTTFDIRDDVITVALVNFFRMPALTKYYQHTNQLSGNLPNLSSNLLLQQFYGSGNQYNNYISGSFKTQKYLSVLALGTNLFSVEFVDSVLADLVTSLSISGRVTCTINISGAGNAAPSNPAGLASKATLVAAGWTVTTN